jgi:hypothetical protein
MSSAAVALSTGVNSGVPLPTLINPIFLMFIAAFRSQFIERPSYFAMVYAIPEFQVMLDISTFRANL